MHLALVLDNNVSPAGASGLALLVFDANGLAFFDVLESDNTAGFGENRYAVGIPPDKSLPWLDLLALLDHDVRTVWDLVLVNFAIFVVVYGYFAVSLKYDQARLYRPTGCRLTLSLHVSRYEFMPILVPEVRCLGNGIEIPIFNSTRNGRKNFGFDDRAGCDSAGVECAHGQLRARFAD